MLQDDGIAPPFTAPSRQAWMRLLSRAPLDMLEIHVASLAGTHPRWLRRPESGLVMIQGRIGGNGERFNLGEVTVTRCALRPDPARVACEHVGIAYVLGRSARHAELAATADALLQDPLNRSRLPADLLTRITEWLTDQHAVQQEKARATRVEFFTVARESAGEHTEDMP
ncbi:MAG: phosphonate C-P lyase system protein PhnG [Pseudomonadota bacterium]|jgi:alpha-D-ribose 1-methylphosphonate 5-triphosphate synthase subunit PhnG|nr:phosphonate C-P lyase system protein PhnG [Pseudomonadota bacterium]